MKFYDRDKEISELLRLDGLAKENAQFTVLMGRRCTGKTTLMSEAFKNERYLYFFIGKKAEQIQCAEFQQQTEKVLGLHIHGKVTTLAALLEEIFVYSKQNKVTVIIDEFQRLAEIDNGIISAIQAVWDYNPQKLEKKYERIKHNLRGYKVELTGLSMEEDM